MIVKGDVLTFSVPRCSEKEQALKPIEEAAEIFGAYQAMTLIDSPSTRIDFIDECADTICAVLNTLKRFGFDEEDLRQAISRCNDRNISRGRIQNDEGNLGQVIHLPRA